MNLTLQISVFLSLITAFIIAYSSIPTIVRVANAKNLFAEPSYRRPHHGSVPILGGVAIFSALLISVGLFSEFTAHKEFQYFFIASIVLFLIGIKDDILVTAPLKKLLSEISSALIIIILGDFRFTNLHGFLGVYEMNYYLSIALSLFVYIVIINGFNLIDGIDGLAAGVGILSSLVFGTWFFLNCNYEYAIIAASLIGSLIAFFWYNVYGEKYKIFMGDGGSLILGLTLAILATEFNEMNIVQSGKWAIHAAPSVSFGILIIPLFDTLRVFAIRTFRGVSPFRADKNHVHHRLLAMGMSHIRATTYILIVNIIIIFIVFTLNRWGVIRLMILNLILATCFSIIPEMLFKLKAKKGPEK
jgi:UDP-N-acetylmuramyl pentapeptide phosphotransferase/UDP-N-acetylglucosamine-1-phosphate transferase